MNDRITTPETECYSCFPVDNLRIRGVYYEGNSFPFLKSFSTDGASVFFIHAVSKEHRWFFMKPNECVRDADRFDKFKKSLLRWLRSRSEHVSVTPCGVIPKFLFGPVILFKDPEGNISGVSMRYYALAQKYTKYDLVTYYPESRCFFFWQGRKPVAMVMQIRPGHDSNYFTGIVNAVDTRDEICVDICEKCGHTDTVKSFDIPRSRCQGCLDNFIYDHEIDEDTKYDESEIEDLRDEIRDHNRKLNDLASDYADAVSALRAVEWIESDDLYRDIRRCPFCESREENNHGEHCQIRRALERANELGI